MRKRFSNNSDRESRILTPADEHALKDARRRGRQHATIAEIPNHTMRVYRLDGKEALLARWDDLDYAIYRLSSTFDRQARSPSHQDLIRLERARIFLADIAEKSRELQKKKKSKIHSKLRLVG